MLGNFAYLPSNYRLFYGAFLFALIGNMLFIFIKHPAWTFSLPTVIVLFLINVFFGQNTRRNLFLAQQMHCFMFCSSSWYFTITNIMLILILIVSLSPISS